MAYNELMPQVDPDGPPADTRDHRRAVWRAFSCRDRRLDRCRTRLVERCGCFETGLLERDLMQDHKVMYRTSIEALQQDTESFEIQTLNRQRSSTLPLHVHASLERPILLIPTVLNLSRANHSTLHTRNLHPPRPLQTPLSKKLLLAHVKLR